MKKALIHEIAFVVNFNWLPVIYFSCNKWLVNCQRSVLCAKPIDILNNNYPVCSDRFENIMFPKVERTRLLFTAIVLFLQDLVATLKLKLKQLHMIVKTCRLWWWFINWRNHCYKHTLKSRSTSYVACKYLI